MIEDFREGAGPFRHDADVCIVGAGPAGLAIAHALSGTRHRVCLVEGGGLACEEESQRLCEGSSVGEPGLDPGRSRLRVAGGSCRLWGGGCIPLAPADFEPRAWVPHSGWPIRYADIEPWYARAREVCGLGGVGFGDGSFDARAGQLQSMFDFTQSNNKRVLLNRNGSVASITPIHGGTPMHATQVVTK